MAQVGFANRADGFCAQHTVGSVNPFFYGGRVCSLIETGPTAACVKFGVRPKQHTVAANAAVLSFSPMRFIPARVGAFGGCMACHFVGHRFCVFGRQVCAPFGTVLREFHEEQLIEIEEAQSGGKAARCSNRGCSSNGDIRTWVNSSTSVKLPIFA